MIVLEVPKKSLDDEIERLERIQKAIPPGKSYVRFQAQVSIRALEWLRDGKLPPSKYLE